MRSAMKLSKTISRVAGAVSIFILLIAAAALNSSAEDELSLKEILERHCQAREEVDHMEARFVQTRHFVVFGEEEVSKGRFFYGGIGRLRWQFTEPDSSWTVISGEEGWTVFPGIKQVQRFGISGSSADRVLSIVGFGPCGDSLTAHFDISVQAQDGSTTILEMIPKDESIAPYFTNITMTLGLSDYLPRRIVMRETSGDLFEIELLDINLDHPQDGSLFELTVPEDFEVIRY